MDPNRRRSQRSIDFERIFPPSLYEAESLDLQLDRINQALQTILEKRNSVDYREGSPSKLYHSSRRTISLDPTMSLEEEVSETSRFVLDDEDLLALRLEHVAYSLERTRMTNEDMRSFLWRDSTCTALAVHSTAADVSALASDLLLAAETESQLRLDLGQITVHLTISQEGEDRLQTSHSKSKAFVAFKQQQDLAQAQLEYRQAELDELATRLAYKQEDLQKAADALRTQEQTLAQREIQATAATESLVVQRELLLKAKDQLRTSKALFCSQVADIRERLEALANEHTEWPQYSQDAQRFHHEDHTVQLLKSLQAKLQFDEQQRLEVHNKLVQEWAQANAGQAVKAFCEDLLRQRRALNALEVSAVQNETAFANRVHRLVEHERTFRTDQAKLKTVEQTLRSNLAQALDVLRQDV